MKFGNHLKQERLQRKFTQQKVAHDLNVSRQTISSWETEHSYPDIGSLIRLSDYYQVSLDQLLKEDTGMTEYLKKQEILKSIKPIIWILTAIDIIFLGFLILSLFNIIKLTTLVSVIIFVMGVLNITAMFILTHFRNKIEIKTDNQSNHFKILIFLTALSLIASITFYFAGQYKFSGLFSGIFASLLVIMIVRKLKK
ncbi:helix-turn-helix domain-containing protein [Companilactobacillus futsaii]|uniref:Helix-turn-helix transcriptional regulator n=2 Tax=Companilactobacillus futsaii TaxID=938155 RepID=A0A5B7T657_9LACO|nr:helix-turn-helix transcriptional regulator [Companilactobacillus futsaii]KRK95332.1 helix-turn-helix domain-containing protein [Companilactobacillus futsaii JCM 17355]QCX25895.1 helix-turn-helix transcriptional regulator [Companilactobacillus futsaii]